VAYFSVVNQLFVGKTSKTDSYSAGQETPLVLFQLEGALPRSQRAAGDAF
jgi:hypothetical protein